MPRTTPISQRISDMKYRLRRMDGEVWTNHPRYLDARRRPPPSRRKAAPLEGRFREALDDFKFLPAGRISGRRRRSAGDPVQLFRHGEFPTTWAAFLKPWGSRLDHATAAASVGDFSTLRPKGRYPGGGGRFRAVEFHGCLGRHVPTIVSAGSRRGAMMAPCCDHPDIEDFIEAKRSRAASHVQSLGVGHRPLHAGREGDATWALTSTARRARRFLPVNSGTRSCGHLCLCGTRGDFHRPDQPAQQPTLL